MRVAIVGAGLSGLVTIKELREEGHQVVCYEKDSSIGGVFSLKPRGALYKSTRLTVSNHFMAFSGLAAEEPNWKYWTHTEYLDYLQDYVDKFALASAIEFNSEIIGLSLEGEKPCLTIRQNDREITDEFDAVAICAGNFQEAKRPALPGEHEFKGRIIHSEQYLDAQPFVGKRVLCIGLGETGTDIVHEISQVAKSCTVSLRKRPAVIQRYPMSKPFPNDAYTSRALYSFPVGTLQASTMDLYSKLKRKTDQPKDHIIYDWIVKADGGFNQPFTKNDVFFKDIVDGKLQVRFSALTKLDESSACFEDGSREEYDAIVLCTGYDNKLSFINPRPFDNPRNLYKHMIHPTLHEKCVFIGWARPNAGGVPTCSELQARYFALLCSGLVVLPEPEQMKRIIKEDKESEENYFNASTLNNIVNYSSFSDDMARLVGCYPYSWRLIFRPILAYKLWFGSQTAFHYRLRGPHSDKSAAEKAIMRLPVVSVFPGYVLLMGIWGVLSLIPGLNNLVNAVSKKIIPTLRKRDARLADAGE